MSTPYAAATRAAKSLLDVIRADGGIPPDFWHHPYVLGFLYFFIHGIALQAGDRSGTYDNIPTVYMELCGRDGVEVLQRSMVFNMNKDTDYVDGMEAADKLLSVLRGSSEYDDDPIVANAHHKTADMARDLRKAGRPLSVNLLPIVLLDAIFLTQLRRRLRLGAPANGLAH